MSERINCRVSVLVRYDEDEVTQPFSSLDLAWRHFDERKRQGQRVRLVDEITGDTLREWRP